MRWLAVAAVLTLGIGTDRDAAQRPERQQALRIPGLDLVLPEGWQAVLHDGCRFAVPGSWRSNADGTLALGPDGSSITLHVLKGTAWAAHKAQARAALGPITVLHDDSDRRLWCEFVIASRVEHYVDVANGSTVCSALLDIRATTPSSVAVEIAESIGPAPTHWSPGGQ